LLPSPGTEAERVTDRAAPPETKDWSLHLQSVVARSFSSEARIAAVAERPDLVLIISWKLETDPKRPDKRSKTIRLVLEEEALIEYAAAPPRHRQMGDARLEEHLTDQLRRFDPDHRAAFGHEPPVVLWTIGAVTLLG
jgi:hypothetical protein